MPLIADRAVFVLRRRGAGRWGVPVAAIAAFVLAVGVSAALTVSRIDHGNAADGGRPPAISAYTASSGTLGR
jgi:hypothetical protein